MISKYYLYDIFAYVCVFPCCASPTDSTSDFGTCEDMLQFGVVSAQTIRDHALLVGLIPSSWTLYLSLPQIELPAFPGPFT